MHVCACETLAVMHIVMSVFQIVLALLGVLHCILCPSILLCSNVFVLANSWIVAAVWSSLGSVVKSQDFTQQTWVKVPVSPI